MAYNTWVIIMTEKKKTVEKKKRSRPITASCVQDIMLTTFCSCFLCGLLYGMSAISYTSGSLWGHIAIALTWILYVVLLLVCVCYIFYLLTTENDVCTTV